MSQKGSEIKMQNYFVNISKYRYLKEPTITS